MLLLVRSTAGLMHKVLCNHDRHEANSSLQQADQEALRTLKDTIATISSRLTQLGEGRCT